MDIDIDISISDIRPIPVATTVAGQPILPGGGWLAGWSLLETTGAAGASCKITSGGNLIAVIGVGAGMSSNVYHGEKGIYCAGDITLTVLAGSIQGAVYATFTKPGSGN